MSLFNLGNKLHMDGFQASQLGPCGVETRPLQAHIIVKWN